MPAVLLEPPQESETLRFRLTIAYDGSAYAGWQVQKIGLGVQQKVEESLGRLFPTIGRVHSSSRTDTGVHALGMVVHVDILRSEFRMSVPKLAFAINANLPEDIRVMAVARVPARFHARFDARGKQYRYFVWNHFAADPLTRKTSWHVPGPLDVPAMRRAAGQLVGRHDFKSFAANRHYEMETTVRTVTRLDLQRRGHLLTFVIEADGFLYKMCRGFVGTLIQIGQGKISDRDLSGMLEGRDRRLAGMTAPAHGLVLWKVFYSGPAKAAQSQRAKVS